MIIRMGQEPRMNDRAMGNIWGWAKIIATGGFGALSPEIRAEAAAPIGQKRYLLRDGTKLVDDAADKAQKLELAYSNLITQKTAGNTNLQPYIDAVNGALRDAKTVLTPSQILTITTTYGITLTDTYATSPAEIKTISMTPVSKYIIPDSVNMTARKQTSSVAAFAVPALALTAAGFLFK